MRAIKDAGFERVSVSLWQTKFPVEKFEETIAGLRSIASIINTQMKNSRILDASFGEGSSRHEEFMEMVEALASGALTIERLSVLAVAPDKIEPTLADADEDDTFAVTVTRVANRDGEVGVSVQFGIGRINIFEVPGMDGQVAWEALSAAYPGAKPKFGEHLEFAAIVEELMKEWG